jgi:hypothetical protein
MAVQPIGGVLLAAGLDWLEGLLPLLFVVIWVVSQVLNLFRGARPKDAAKPQPNPRAERPPRPVPGGLRPVRPAAGRPEGDVALDREIEEFLRRSLARGEPKVLEEPPAPPRPRRNGGKPSRKRSRSQAEAAAALPVPIAPRGAAAGGDIASHVENAFAHDLAHASPSTVGQAVVAAQEAPGAALTAALQAPGGLRQLILMREVLDRPVHRW